MIILHLLVDLYVFNIVALNYKFNCMKLIYACMYNILLHIA